MSWIRSSGGHQVRRVSQLASFTDTFNRADVTPMDNGWQFVDTTNQTAARILGNVALGTTTASATPPPYNDAIILRPNFGTANYKISGTIYLRAGFSGSGNREVEIWGRGSEGVSRTNAIGTSTAYGYECNTQINGDYLNVNRYFDTGPPLASLTAIGAWTNGDLFEVAFTDAAPGCRIRVWVRGSLVIDVTDSAAGFYASGDPGLGFYQDNGNRTDDFGFDAVTITPL